MTNNMMDILIGLNLLDKGTLGIQQRNRCI